MHTESHLRTARFCALFIGLALLGVPTMAADKVSTGGGGDWENDATWVGAAPTATDDVFIAAGDTVTINGLSTIHINSLSVSGTLVHADNNAEPAENKIILSITNDFTVALGGSIALEGLGFGAGKGPGTPLATYSGGSYGGMGGVFAPGVRSDAGPTYGSYSSPTNLGSGGTSESGSRGGGAVQVAAGGTTTLNGTILADGGHGTSYSAGAGGSVFITTADFAGSGSISANGGFISTGGHGAGGGGRIAVVLTNGSSFGSVTMTAYAGGAGLNDNRGSSGMPSAGTIYTKIPGQSYGTLKIDAGGDDLVEESTVTLGTRIPSTQTWSLDALDLVNGGNLWVPTNTTLNADSTDFSGSTTNGYLIIDSHGTLAGGSDLTISNVTFMPLAGSKFTGTTNLTIDASAVVAHIKNSTSEDWTLEIDIVGNLTIPAGARIDVDGLGYDKQAGPGRPRYANGNTYLYGHGGSYGGRGGKSSYAEDSGPTYGSVTAPGNIGSGGGWCSCSPSTNDGGGAIKLTVGGTTTLNGELSADGIGYAAVGSVMGGGSGGSVWLTTSNLTGNGTITADGGPATWSNGAGGGGGRISVVLTGSDSFGSVTMQAFGGSAVAASTEGAAGTIYKQTQAQGAGMGDLLVDNDSQDSNRATEISTNVTDTAVGTVTFLNGADFGMAEGATLTVQGGTWSNGNEFAAESGSLVRFVTTNTTTIYGNQTFYGFSCTNAGKTLKFENGKTNTVEEALTLTGDASDYLYLRSTSDGSQWYLNVKGTADMIVEYVDVKDSNADAGYGTGIAALDSSNSQNNVNWSFVVPGETNTWIGVSSTSWAIPGNWDRGRPPQSTDGAVIISNGCANYPLLATARSVEQDLVMQTGSSITLSGNDFTVTGDATIGGSLIASGTETIRFLGDVDFTGGSFTKASTLVYVGGTAAQTITSAGQSFYRLTVTNDSGLVTFTDAAQATYYRSESADVTYSNNFTAMQFRVFSDNGPVTQTFHNGSTYAFTDLFFFGEAGKVQTLESTDSGTWSLNVSGAAYVNYVDASYSDASGGIPIVAANSTDSGNNTDWLFGGSWKVWTGGSGSSFGTAASWSPSGVPASTNYILVDSTTTLTVDSDYTVHYALIGGENATLMEVNNGLTVVSNVVVMENGVLEVNNDPGLTVSNDMVVSIGGVVNHNQNSTTEDDTMSITVDGDLSILAGGRIDVDGLGYRYRSGPGRPREPDGDTYLYGHGGSHGGRGGYTASYPLGDSGPTYGSVTAPVNLGSGGGWNGSGGTNNGGGAIKLTVGGTTAVNGELSADGIGNVGSAQGGGSGGSVWLTTSNLSGSGTITADGGRTFWSNGAGGGGGRISVVLTGSDSFGSVTMRAFGGTSIDAPEKGAAGTIYRETQAQGAGMGDLLIDNNSQDSNRATEISTNTTDAAVGTVVFLNGADFGTSTGATFTLQGSVWSNGNDFVAEGGSVVRFTTTNTVTLYGSSTFYGFSCTNAGKTMQFAAGDTNTVLEDLTLTGDTSDDLVLRPAPGGSPWYLSVHGDAAQNVDYVDVAYSHADVGYGTTINAQNSEDSLNNVNWSFVQAGVTNTWIGVDSTSWSAGNNWDQGNPPQSTDAAVVISNACNNYPVLTSDVTVETNLIMLAGSSITLAGNNFTVVGDADIDGVLVASGTEAVTFLADLDFTGGTFTQASTTVYIGGTAAQSITCAGEVFHALTVTNNSGLVTFTDAVQATQYRSESADVTYGADITATEFHVYSEGGAVTHTFTAGSTCTVERLWLHGSTGNTQHLESAGTWYLDVSGMCHARHVNAEYSDASGGETIVPFNSFDGGNNVNWVFGGPFAVWTGAGGSTFDTAASWDPPGVPDATTYILVDTNATLTVSSPASVEYALIGGENTTFMEINSSFTVVSNVDVVDNATVEINDDPGMTVSNDMYVGPGATLTHNDNSIAEADRMVLTVEGDLTIAAGAEIDVTGLGYNGGYGTGLPSASYSGGSYGGMGGVFAPGVRSDAGPTYGSYSSPTNLGSGGTTESTATGGGAVQLNVGGMTTIDGDILAAGKNHSSYNGGSGGSVWITTGSFAGSGTISANGGFVSYGGHGAGGGGRIAVVLTNGSTFGSVSMTAYAGGAGLNDNRGSGGGMPSAGTIYRRIPGQSYGTLKVDAGGDDLVEESMVTLGTRIPSNQTWQLDALELVNGGVLWVPTNTTLNADGTDFSGSTTNGYLLIDSHGTLAGSASLTISNVTLIPLADSVFTITHLTIDPSARVTHIGNTTSEDWTLEIDIPGNLTIPAGASIDVDGLGYRRQSGPGRPRYPDGSTYLYGHGGSYGGRGGYSSSYAPGDSGPTYGSVTAPVNIGSGGGYNGGGGICNGGGVIKLTVGGTTALDGELSADGVGIAGSSQGGGSGGSVWLTTSSLTGSGTITADGGPEPIYGGGGGGRISVVLTGADSFGSVAMQTYGGSGGQGDGAAGTIYKQTQTQGAGGGTVLIDNNGQDSNRSTYAPPETNAVADELLATTLIITNSGSEVTLSTNLWVDDILVYTNANLVLGVYTMFVDSVEHHIDDTAQSGAGGPTNGVDSYDQIVWQGADPGLMIIVR